MGNIILLTGSPGCGKTTLIRRVLAQIQAKAGGFYTQEIRQDGRRRGFELITLEGKRGILAHVEIRSHQHIGKYGVDLTTMKDIAVPAILDAAVEGNVVVIDEIGPMEMLSGSFRQAVMQVLDSDSTVLGTIVRRSTPFGDQIKSRAGVTIIEVRPGNRDSLAEAIIEMLIKK